MSKELKIYTEGRKIFLAVGFIEDKESYSNSDYLRYRAENSLGQELYTDEYQEALDFIAEGLNPPKNYTL